MISEFFTKPDSCYTNVKKIQTDCYMTLTGIWPTQWIWSSGGSHKEVDSPVKILLDPWRKFLRGTNFCELLFMSKWKRWLFSIQGPWLLSLCYGDDQFCFLAPLANRIFPKSLMDYHYPAWSNNSLKTERINTENLLCLNWPLFLHPLCLFCYLLASIIGNFF